MSQRQSLQHTVQAFFQRSIRYPACTLVCGKHINQQVLLFLHGTKRASCTNPVLPIDNIEPMDRVAGKSPTGNPIRASPSRILIGNCSPRTPQLGTCHTTTRLASFAIPCLLLEFQPCLFLPTHQDLRDGFVCSQAACAPNRQQTVLRIKRQHSLQSCFLDFTKMADPYQGNDPTAL
jgi:hypothetical protein